MVNDNNDRLRLIQNWKLIFDNNRWLNIYRPQIFKALEVRTLGIYTLPLQSDTQKAFSVLMGYQSRPTLAWIVAQLCIHLDDILPDAYITWTNFHETCFSDSSQLIPHCHLCTCIGWKTWSVVDICTRCISWSVCAIDQYLPSELRARSRRERHNVVIWM